MVTESLGWCLELGLNRHARFYVGRPVFYTGGLVLSLATLTVGGSLLYVDNIDDDQPEHAWAALLEISSRHNPDWAFFIPDQLRFFVSKVKEEMRFGPFPKQILTMGAPISGEEKVAVSQAFNCNVIESWGNSESLGTITDAEDLSTRPDSIGRPFLTDELFIVDETGNRLGPNQIGRIAGHREAGFTKYARQDEATKATIVGDMIISDDIGKTDEGGRFYVLGREADLISVSGRPVTVAMIERTVRLKYPQLRFVIILLTRDQRQPQLGILTEGATKSTVVEVASLISQEHGFEFRFRHLNVDSLPKLPTGKPDRMRIADILGRA